MPKEEEFIRRSDNTENEGWDDVVDTLEVTKRTLSFLKGNGMDLKKKLDDKAESAYNTAKAKCDLKRTVAKKAKDKYEMLELKCQMTWKVIVGTSNPAYNICLKFQYKFLIAKDFLADKATACDTAANAVRIYTDAYKWTWWKIHYALKIA